MKRSSSLTVTQAASLQSDKSTASCATFSVSNRLNPATDNHFKCHHFEKASVPGVGSAAIWHKELADGESAQDGRASGNHRTRAAEVVVSSDRRGTWRRSGDGVPAY